MTAERERPAALPPRVVIRTAWVLHRALLRFSGGRIGLRPPEAGTRFGMLRLRTLGRRSGEPRVAIVGYLEDGPNLVTLAMNGWAEAEPAWWLNLQAQPDTTVELTDGVRAVRGRAAEGEERDRLWARWREFSDDYDAWAAMRSAQTAVVVLEPRAGVEAGRPDRSMAEQDRPAAAHPMRTAALAAGIGLLAMAILAPIAQFGVLASLIVPADAAATTGNIAASIGLFGAAIAAFLVVAILDVVVAWGMYVLLRPVSERAALLVAWLRVAYAVAFAYAVLNMLAVAQLVSGATAATLESDQLHMQVATSIAAFRDGWDLALAIFGLHLVGLGGLLYRSADFPRFLGVLVVLAGAGYLADSLGRILVPGYALTISTFTFVGEALLIAWLFKVAVKGSRATTSLRTVPRAPVQASEGVAS